MPVRTAALFSLPFLAIDLAGLAADRGSWIVYTPRMALKHLFAGLLLLIALLAQKPASNASEVGSPAPTVPSDTGSSVTQAQAQAALDFHNAKRHDVGVAPLQWSTKLAAVAQNWANHLAKDEGCNLSHTQNNSYGENLFGGRGGKYTALIAAQAWCSEISKYQYGVLTSSNYFPTGHYTQMIWHDTTEVGMGQATCSGGGIVIAAEYNPPGNVIGEKPY
jgi:pathogenesis-related protein 1